MSIPTFVHRLKNSYYAPVFVTGGIAVVIFSLTRLLLLMKSAHGLAYSFMNLTGIFGIGLLYDIVVAGCIVVPLVLHLWGTNDKMYAGAGRWLIPLAFIVILLLLWFADLVPKDFNAGLRTAVVGYFIARLVIYLFLLNLGRLRRHRWRKGVIMADIFIITFVLLLNAVSEWFFWDEFSVRYNFIAVDYLVYTNEVMGNIRESYPLVRIVLALVAATVLVLWFIRRPLLQSVEKRPSFVNRTLIFMTLLLIPVAGCFFLTGKWHRFSNNEYANELAGNGLFEFAAAFRNNELDYYKFYTTLPDREAFTLLRQQLQTPNSRFASPDVFNIERTITYGEPEKRMNVVLVSVESLSADFMQAFGNTQNITPNLDSLAAKSMFFTSLYASGTRTVRGLEALALSIPPTPGQSIVKRPGNEHLFSLGAVFQSKGYITQYLYGGYGYFDNMNYFFSHNAYQVIDRTALLPQQIHYANIWGVADEDLFTLALHQMDSNYATRQPFFAHVMTVSNHRPFTYPEGRIDIPPAQQSREGAVKYTDYAIGRFLREARQKPWFSNTLFVIVADHCAGSAGSVQLPVTGYHIPMLIYSPGNIEPQQVTCLTAQIDIAPTILGLLKFSYKTEFFGQDVFTISKEQERAFISTYQGLGFLRNNRLVIQSPVRKAQEFIPDFISGKATPTAITDSLFKQSIAWYQCASWLIRNRKYRPVL
jgi:phosphoglycerol transferase MdoB-like AlkP superfamily enzyme